jgi:hypothetical protein
LLPGKGKQYIMEIERERRRHEELLAAIGFVTPD